MGSFFNTVFSILLGWLQGLVSMIWNAFTDHDGETFLQYIGNNWIMIAAVLCVIGLVFDFAVYFFRWEPYKVWRTFWRRIRKNRKSLVPEESDALFAPENISEETIYTGRENRIADETAPDLPYETDELIRWRKSEEDSVNTSRTAPPDITRAGYVVPADSPYRRPAAAGAGMEEPEHIKSSGISSRRRRKFSAILGDSDDEQFHYFAPKPIIDQRDAYREPVYPEKWKESRERDS